MAPEEHLPLARGRVVNGQIIMEHGGPPGSVEFLTQFAEQPVTELTRDARAATAWAWLREFFGDLANLGGSVRLGLDGPEGWDELQPFSPGCAPGVPDTHEALLDWLAQAIVGTSDRPDVNLFAVPYLHGRHARRRNGGALTRRHIHADLDGPPLDAWRPKALGAMVVASGSYNADGSPRSHVYARLDRTVSAEDHSALCRAMGQWMAGPSHDTSKTNDSDYLRPVGSVNTKHGQRNPVRWITPPDDPSVKTWTPEALARLLGLGWPIRPVEELEEAPAAPAPIRSAGRFEGRLRRLAEATEGTRNGLLFWAAKLAGAEDAGPEADAELLAVARGLGLPDSEARATIRSGRKHGIEHRAEVLGQGDHYTADAGDQEDQPVTGSKNTLADRVRAVDWQSVVLDDLPPVEWLIPGLLPEGASASLYSPAGVGKSLLALELAAALATGRGVLGHEPTGSIKRVLYVDLENDVRLIQGRIRAMGYTSASDAEGLAENLVYSLLGDWPPLDTREGGNQLAEAVEAYGAQVVIIDTTQRVIKGEENDSGTFRALHLHALLKLRRMGVTVMRLDHAGKDPDKGQRGSSGKSDDVDLVYRLSEVVKGRHYRLKREKNRPGLDAATERLDLYRLSEPLRHEIGPESVALDGHDEADDLLADVEELGRLDPPPTSQRDVQRRLGWGGTRALGALREWRERSAERSART